MKHAHIRIKGFTAAIGIIVIGLVAMVALGVKSWFGAGR